jgi:hypothetical protein
MWLANFEGGLAISSKRSFWDRLPREKRMTGVQLSHPYLPKLFVCLSDLDRYYYTQEAVAFLQGGQSATVVAEIIGGHDLKLGVGVEVRLSYTGSVSIRTYPLERYKYSPKILYDGLGNGRPPKVEVVADAPESTST